MEAEAAIEAFIERAKSGDASSQKQVAEFYCSDLGKLPVEGAGLVHQKYRTAENCSEIGLPILRRLAESGDLDAKWKLASYLNSSLTLINHGIAPNDAEAFKWYFDIASNALPSKDDSSKKWASAMWVAEFYE
jgi:hypothetical protein